VVAMKKLDFNKLMTSGNGILLLGVLWLIFWLFPAFYLFQEDPRWGHNFAIPIIFITVGLAYNINKISCQLTGVIASYLIIPILLAFWPWDTSTIITIAFLCVLILLYFIERIRKTELINPKQKLKSWLKIHAMTFAYLGLVHMSLIFFLVRWFNPDPFIKYLPIEHHVSTSTFNSMLFILIILAIMERFVKKLGRVNIPKMGFFWSVLMVIVPLIAINILGE
jgi:hypothetical protein